VKRIRRRGAEIDITPLIDVLFMLIIFFVLTTVFVRGTLDVDLPVGSPPPPSDKNPVVLTVLSDSSILWAGREISRENLAAAVNEAVVKSLDILVAGDKAARYGDVAELLELLRDIGVPDVAIAFEERRP
jgi:biopolymer transport protein ExbD